MGRADLFKSLGLHPERNLGGDVADFYLMEACIGNKVRDGMRGDTYDGNPVAVTLFEKLVAEVAQEFSIYLDMACGGELRHGLYIGQPITDDEPADMQAKFHSYLIEHGFDRGKAWKKWMACRRKAPKATLPWLKWAGEAFVNPVWAERSRGTGGTGWATAARVTFDYLSGTLKARTFIDRAFTIQHNNGHIFDKTYHHLDDLTRALEEQARGDYRALSVRATPYIANVWRRHARRARVYDPTVGVPTPSAQSTPTPDEQQAVSDQPVSKAGNPFPKVDLDEWLAFYAGVTVPAARDRDPLAHAQSEGGPARATDVGPR